jgi:hypothetical protein
MVPSTEVLSKVGKLAKLNTGRQALVFSLTEMEKEER